MNAASAPGPDGLGPNFYAATWDTTKGEVMNFLQDFHSESANLECINRALIVLIPKTTPALTPNAFRPVSLQNCPVKILTKILTTRLQQQIPKLIDIDQTGFIKGRSIFENFIYATELVQCCHKRRVPTLVIKLDFAKAFDSVNWDSLDTVLHAQGFPNVWQRWMQHLLTSSKSAVMVNGIPGPWIQCRRGLCQGDALSSYLFLLMADVLQRLIKKGGGIRHPLMEGPCPMFQYADDTIILVSGELEDVTRLKQVLLVLCSNWTSHQLPQKHYDSNACAERGAPGHDTSSPMPRRDIPPSIPRAAIVQCEAATFCICSTDSESRPLLGRVEGNSAQHCRACGAHKLGVRWASYIRHGGSDVTPWGQGCFRRQKEGISVGGYRQDKWSSVSGGMGTGL